MIALAWFLAGAVALAALRVTAYTGPHGDPLWLAGVWTGPPVLAGLVALVRAEQRFARWWWSE